jgi:plastocyanin domain-containing protein
VREVKLTIFLRVIILIELLWFILGKSQHAVMHACEKYKYVSFSCDSGQGLILNKRFLGNALIQT